MKAKFFQFISLICASALVIQSAHVHAQNQQAAPDIAQVVDENIAKLFRHLETGDSNLARVTFLEDTRPFGEYLAEVTPRFSKDSSQYFFDVRIPKGGLKNPFVLQEVIHELGAFGLVSFSFGDRALEQARELRFEAANGNVEARLWLSVIREVEVLYPYMDVDPDSLNREMMKRAAEYFEMKKQPMPENVTSYRDLLSQLRNQRYQRIRGEIELLREQAKISHKASLKRWENQKQSLKLMEKISHDKKLNDLVKANARKGVRDMLEAFIPWPLMGRMEREAWKIWLEAIEKPDPKNSIVLFRGLDIKDHPQETKYQGRRSLGLFSTILSRNQGNYTRRLLSLATKRSRSQGFLSSQFKEHSRDPVGSEFISFTTNRSIAEAFTDVNKELVIARVDRRRAIPNTLGLPSENEVLVPLVVFPDEIVSIHKKTSHSFQRQIDAKIVELKLEKDLATTDSSLFNRGREFFREIALRAYGQIRLQRAPVNSCRRIFSVKY